MHARWRPLPGRGDGAQEVPIDGSVFEAPNGMRYTLKTTGTREDAHAIAAASGKETRIFAVRPYWGMAAKAWIDADPEFWEPNPMTRRR